MSNTEISLDSLLDGTIDDLKDLPSNKPFPAGVHSCQLFTDIKRIGEEPKEGESDKRDTAAEFKLVYRETVELNNPSAELPNAGDETSVLFFLTHSNPKVAEMGQGQLKEHLKSLASHFGVKSNKELLAEANGCSVLAVTGIRVDKKKNVGKEYTELKAIQVA
jgi:hypothetical protein